MNTTPDNLRTLLERELDPGESITWSAHPEARLLLKYYRRAFVIISLCFLGLFAVLATPAWIDALGAKPDVTTQHATRISIISAVVVITLAITTYLTIVWVAKHTARTTIYAITEKRAIVLRAYKNGKVDERDYRGDELIHLSRHEEPDGSGTIVFESARGHTRSSQTANTHKFVGIPNVLQVERMLRERFGNN